MTTFTLRLLTFAALLPLFSVLTAVHAETRTTASLTPQAVWEAINAAKDGDTVLLPEGTAVWTKGWNSGHGAKMKAIIIQGAGMDKTVIRTDTTTAGGDKSFVVNGVEGKPFRITGITFDGTGFPTAGTWAGEMVIGGNCKNFRHNKVINSQLEIYRLRPGAYGCQSAEIYDNTFSAEGAKQGRPQGFIFIAGGVALVFNNTVTGTSYNCHTIQVSHDRSFTPIGEFGICDGTNPIDGNQIPAGQPGAGYPCFGQPGRADGCRRRRSVRAIALLRLEQHVQWGEAQHGAAPLGSERDRATGSARKGRPRFLQRGAQARVL